jgi:undecaprenyl-diphosphatase
MVMVVGALTFVACTTLAAAADRPARWELDTFTTVNGLPDWLYVVVWPFMQYGVFVTIPIAALAAVVAHRRRLAWHLLASGVTIYLLAKVVKRIADRGRPDAFLDTVVEREHFAAASLGYTSGHAAVAATIATLTWFHLPKRLRQVSLALVAIVAFGRMYVGAHLPLDIIGGSALGITAGTLVTYLFGTGRRDGLDRPEAT